MNGGAAGARAKELKDEEGVLGMAIPDELSMDGKELVDLLGCLQQ